MRALAEQLHQPRFLHLRLEALLQTVIGFIAVSVGMDGHKRGERKEEGGGLQGKSEDCSVSGYWFFGFWLLSCEE